MRERGTFRPEALPEGRKVQTKYLRTSEKCIVVFELNGYKADVVEVYPLPAWMGPMDIEVSRDLYRAAFIAQPNKRVEIMPAQDFVRWNPPTDMEVAVGMALHILGPGNAARQRLCEFAAEKGADVGALTGTSIEQWDEIVQRAQEFLAADETKVFLLEHVGDFTPKVSDIEMARADGNLRCETCGMFYRKHPDDPELGWGGDGVLRPFLKRLCDGRRVKL